MGIPHQQQHQNCKCVYRCIRLQRATETHLTAAAVAITEGRVIINSKRFGLTTSWNLLITARYFSFSLDFNNDKVVRSFHELFGPLGKKAGQPVRWEKIVIFIISLITGFSRVMLSSANNNKEKKKNKRGGVRDLNLIRKHAQQQWKSITRACREKWLNLHLDISLIIFSYIQSHLTTVFPRPWTIRKQRRWASKRWG